MTDRYQQAHEQDFKLKYPQAYASGHYFNPKPPPAGKANGLTQMIVNFLLWSGHRATRIGSTGRIIKEPKRQASGISLQTNKWIPGTTRKGAADISATIHGRAVMIEVKAGRDRPSDYQLREQALERKAGGQYEFIHSFDEFIEWYDGFLLTLK